VHYLRRLLLLAAQLVCEDGIGAVGIVIFQAVHIVAVHIEHMVPQGRAHPVFGRKLEVHYRATMVAQVAVPGLQQRPAVKRM
jgi:hypothetical protein